MRIGLLTRLGQFYRSSTHRNERTRVYWFLLVLFIALILLTRWITRHVQGLGYLLTDDGQIAMILYFLLIFPGVLVHEVSHALAAWALHVRVHHLAIGIRRKANSRQVALGSVNIASTDPLRASLIGLAPLVVGCAAILLISDRVLDVRMLATFSVESFWQEIKRVWSVPDVGLWAYLVFAVGNAMLPSSSDRKAWGPALILAAFVGALVYFSGLFDALSGSLNSWLRNGANRLTYAFAVTVLIDLGFAAALFVIEQALALLGFGRLKYH